MANQYALPTDERRKQRQEEARKANRQASITNIPKVPDPLAALPSQNVNEGATIAFESMGLPRWLAEKLGQAYGTGMGYVPFLGKYLSVADEVSMTPEQRLANLDIQPISPTDTGGTNPMAAIMVGQGASSFPSLFAKPAQEDLSRGRSPTETWREWGIEQDPAGNLVSEIPDNDVRVTNVQPSTQPLPTGQTLEEGVRHPKLVENYPEAGKTEYTAVAVPHHPYSGPQYGGGFYKPGEMTPHGTAGPEGRIRVTSSLPDQKDPHSVRGLTVHEAQHKVQQLEGFPRGGNQREQGMYPLGEKLVKQARKEWADRRKAGEDPNSREMQQLDKIARTPKDQWAHLGYQSQAGEVQARNAASRMDMPARERADTPPSATEDMPRSYQTVTPQDAPRLPTMSEGPINEEMGDRDRLRNQLAEVAAPAVHTKGNEPLIEQIYKTAAETQPENLYTPATNPVFKTEGDPAALTKEMVPQVSRESEITPNIMPARGYPRGGRINQIVENQEAIARRIVQDLQASGITIPFYGTAPVLQTLIDQGVLSPGQAMLFMRDWAGQGAATSMRTETPQNLRNSSYLLFRRAQGDPLTPERQAEEAAGGRWGTYQTREKGKGLIDKPRLNRPGFQMLEEHTKRADEMANETIDPWKNTKPFLFREGWSGNMADVTADTHNIRSILDVYDQLFPGTLSRGWFENDAAFQNYLSGGGFNRQGQLPIGDIKDALPQPMIPGTGREGQVEYPLIAGPTRRAAEIMNISPGEAQERMWFNYGPRTGLQSPLQTIPDLLNSQIEATARATGMSPEAIMRLWGRRGIPLAQNEESPMQGTSMVG